MKTNRVATPQSADLNSAIEGNKMNFNERHDKGLVPSYLASKLNINLYWLANKLTRDCYSMRHPSKELMRSFIIDIEHLRSEIS